MVVRISHIYREGNSVADKLANYGALNDGLHWWNLLPQFLLPSFGHDYSSRVSYRFSCLSVRLGLLLGSVLLLVFFGNDLFLYGWFLISLVPRPLLLYVVFFQ